MTKSKKSTLDQNQNNISEKHFRGMVESTAGIPWVANYDTFKFTYVGPQAEKILGYPEEQWYEANFWHEHIHPDDKQATIDYCIAASKKGKDYNFEYRMMHRNGHSVWILDYVNIATDGDTPTQLQGFMFDISKNKQTEQTLQERTLQLDAMYRASPDMIFIHANDGRILDVNKNTAERYGYTVEEMRKLYVADLSADPDSLLLAGERVQQALRGEEPDFEWLARDSRGNAFPVEIRLRKLDGGDASDVSAVIAVVRDISMRKRTEESIKNIAAGVSAQSGEAFYQQMLKHLSKVFDADHAFIGLLDENNPGIVNSLSVFSHGTTAGNISYSLESTPCAEVINGTTCFHPHNVQHDYPKDQLLADMDVDSYIGTPLFDSHDNPIGLIVVLDSEPMQSNSQLTEIL